MFVFDPEKHKFDDREEWVYWLQPPAEPSRKEAEKIHEALEKYITFATCDGIRVALLLARVRDDKLYTFLNYPDLKQYALDGLHLDSETMERYLKLYAWVQAHHPEWYDSDPPLYVRDLTHVADIIWLETTLVRDRHAPEKRAHLVELLEHALAGDLKRTELDRYRRSHPSDYEEMVELLDQMRTQREEAYRLRDELPPDALNKINMAFDLIDNLLALHRTGLDCLDEPAPKPKKA